MNKFIITEPAKLRRSTINFDVNDFCLRCVQKLKTKGSYCDGCQPVAPAQSKVSKFWLTVRAFLKRKGKEFDAMSGY